MEPCARPAEMGCKSGDPELAQWAMEAWQAASDGKLHVERTTEKSQAIIKIYWVSGRTGLYGETRGGDVYVRPEPGRGTPAGGDGLPDLPARDRARAWAWRTRRTSTTSCTTFNMAEISLSTLGVMYGS